MNDAVAFRAWLENEEGQSEGPVVTRYRDANQNPRTTFDKIVKRAGLIMLPIGWGTTWGTRHAKLRKMVKPSQQKTPRKLNVFRGLAV